MTSTTGKTTTDHDEIRRWAEARGARPLAVRLTGGSEAPGNIRLDVPGYGGEETLTEISWDEWFDSFDRNALALVYQETLTEGGLSNFNQLVRRESLAGGRSRRAPRGGRAKAKRTPARRATGKRKAGARKAGRGRATVKSTGTKSRQASTARGKATKRRSRTTGRVRAARQLAAKGGRIRTTRRRGRASNRSRIR